MQIIFTQSFKQLHKAITQTKLKNMADVKSIGSLAKLCITQEFQILKKFPIALNLRSKIY